MYLLYADESGSLTDHDQRFYVLAGVAIFERSTHWIEVELNKVAARFSPDDPYRLELHGSPMRSGSGGWRHASTPQRRQAILDALGVGVANKHPRDTRLFAVVLEKAHHEGLDIAQVAFEQLSSRFDQFLGRLYRSRKEAHRGLILFDECPTERRIQSLAREFKISGHSFGILRNYAEVPVFIDSRASRLIQLADLVAFAIFRKFEHNDDIYFKVIEHCFDTEGGVQHGLYVR